MATSQLEPNLVIPAAPPLPQRNILVGTVEAILIDNDGSPTNILDLTIDNGVNVDWQLQGLNAPQYQNADTFQLTLYLEAASSTVDFNFSSAPILGSTGALSGTSYNAQLSFPAPAAPNPPTITIPMNTVTPGVYRATMVLSHTPAAFNSRIVGFVDLGVVQFFQP